MASRRGSGTMDRILDVAERLVQVRGYNAFSYADVAEAVGIRKASLHHHFPGKADLGAALVARYHGAFFDALAAIDARGANAVERLERYVEVYGSVLRGKRMCLCGMLASEVATLPKAMREGLSRFFDENERWLQRVLEEGRERGELRFEGPAAVTASVFVTSLEGAMLVARGSARPDRFARVRERLLYLVRAEAPVRAKRKVRPRR